MAAADTRRLEGFAAIKYVDSFSCWGDSLPPEDCDDIAARIVP